MSAEPNPIAEAADDTSALVLKYDTTPAATADDVADVVDAWRARGWTD